MRAICGYLASTKAIEDGIAEAQELLTVASDWYLAHNALGFLLFDKKIPEAIEEFQKTVAHNRDHYIGYYNLACSYSMTSQFEACLEQLKALAANEKALFTFHDVGEKFDNDPHFDNIRGNDQHRDEFENICRQIMSYRRDAQE